MFELVLIDDKREVVEGLSRAIDWKAMQVSVHGFFSASEAMAYCMEHPPALVITDICMPVMSGMEFTKSLRAVHPEVRVVLLTGYDDFTYAREGIRLGVVEYLSKPVDLDEVQSLVAKEKACWEEQQAEREKQVAESARYRRGLPTLRSQWLKNARSAQPPTRERLQKDFAGMDLPLQAERLLPVAVRIARKTLTIVHQNIWFALGVKFLVLFLSAIGRANMWMAVFADVGVSVIAILNAGRMLKAK